MSVSLYRQYDDMLCPGGIHFKACYCRILERAYGSRLFKCDLLGCSFRRTGFATKSARDSHSRHHDRPWTCAIEGCEYAKIGFLSQRMRDQHLDNCHQGERAQASLFPDTPASDAAEIKSLLFDLVASDNVEAVRALQSHVRQASATKTNQLIDLAASSGSIAMTQFVIENGLTSSYAGLLHALAASLRGKNLHVLKWVLYRTSKTPREGFYQYKLSYALANLLESDWVEVFEQCDEFLTEKLSSRVNHRRVCPGAPALSLAVIKSTARLPDREERLFRLWATLARKPLSKFLSKKYLGDALGNVADSTCSISVAKVLLGYGAEVDARRSNLYLTPLHRAARRNSPEAAEMIRFLLYRGADPAADAGRAHQSISKEKGAREISKWLGISWDELIDKVKLDRKQGICPPEYL